MEMRQRRERTHAIPSPFLCHHSLPSTSSLYPFPHPPHPLFHNLRIGVTHTATLGLTQTDPIGVTHTVFVVYTSPFWRN